MVAGRFVTGSCAVALCAGALASTAWGTAPPNATAYRAQVNGICRSYTPKFKKYEADMAKAKRAGQMHKWGYDVGYLLALSLRQGLAIEHTAVPADAKPQMAKPLHQLHVVDTEVRTVLSAVFNSDVAGFQKGLSKLEGLTHSLDKDFDAVGLQDCGSKQP